MLQRSSLRVVLVSCVALTMTSVVIPGEASSTGMAAKGRLVIPGVAPSGLAIPVKVNVSAASPEQKEYVAVLGEQNLMTADGKTGEQELKGWEGGTPRIRQAIQEPGGVALTTDGEPGYRLVVPAGLPGLYLPATGAWHVRDLAGAVQDAPYTVSSGSEYVFAGTVPIGDVAVTSDAAFRLVFKMVKGRGLVYLTGKGSVRYGDGRVVRLGSEESFEGAVRRVRSKDVIERLSAVMAIGYLAKTPAQRAQALKLLNTSLGDSSADVRRAAAESFGRSRLREGEPALARVATADHDEWVRATAKAALALLRSTAR